MVVLFCYPDNIYETALNTKPKNIRAMKKIPQFVGLASASIYAATMLQIQSATGFNGLDLNLGNLYRLSRAESRSISPENFTGEKGKGGMATNGTGAYAARELGRGWKVSPSVEIKPKSVFVLAEINGPGAIQQIWMTPTGNWRWSILRMYWDDVRTPSL
jgi:hypothetical protein